MKKSAIFGLGFAAGTVVGIFGLLGWVSLKYPRTTAAKTPSHFQNAILDRAPFDGDWLVFWGGEKRSENHHHGIAPQNLAMDVVMTINGSDRRFVGDQKKNESYACWSRPIYSPIDGIVEVAVDGIPDNIPGDMNRHMVSGNSVMVRSPAGFVVVLCHFKNGSVAKKKGEVVKAGDLLGLCGNSGNSSEPHLHFHVQSKVGFVQGEALRPLFSQIRVEGVVKRNYSPRKGDRISNPNQKPSQAPEPTPGLRPGAADLWR